MVVPRQDEHPAVAHLAYESHDAPRRAVPRRLERIVLEQGVEDAIVTYFELKDEFPPEAFEESMLNDLATRLWNTFDRKDEALELYRLNADVHATSAGAQVDLAVALFASGLRDEARSALEFALELDPNNEEAARRMEALEQED